MWVFGYGSLMGDGWEAEFGCTNSETATLVGYRRDFNKASVRNWGSRTAPGPTLGLAPGGDCVGVAFEFPDEKRVRILAALRDREGRSFALEEKKVLLASDRSIVAVVPVNDSTGGTFIGDRPLEDRARLARTAIGSKGTCLDYVKSIRKRLLELDVRDPGVEAFWALVARE